MARDCSAPETSRTKLDDLGEAASEESQTSLSLLEASANQQSMVEVLEAIRRITQGTYGICEITGEPIEAKRLSAIPWTRYSYAGQDDLEKVGFGRRRGLPAVETVSKDEPPIEEDDYVSDKNAPDDP